MGNREFGQKGLHFSIRKLTIGAMSVILAASMYTALAKPIAVHADQDHRFALQEKSNQDNKMTANEILQGFFLGRSSAAEEYLKNNLSLQDLRQYGLAQNSIHQDCLRWGMYFNYGSQVRAQKPLQNVHFYAYFSPDQIILPSSIKVYELPDQYVAVRGNDNGQQKIKRLAGNNGLYDWLTEPANRRERVDFENYLKENLHDNGFEIDQNRSNKKTTFYVPRADGSYNRHYAAHACFIQLETKLVKA